jgi:hypothetical protein
MAIVAQQIPAEISILTDTKHEIGAYTTIIEVLGSAEQRLPARASPETIYLRCVPCMPRCFAIVSQVYHEGFS